MTATAKELLEASARLRRIESGDSLVEIYDSLARKNPKFVPYWEEWNYYKRAEWAKAASADDRDLLADAWLREHPEDDIKERGQ